VREGQRVTALQLPGEKCVCEEESRRMGSTARGDVEWQI